MTRTATRLLPCAFAIALALAACQTRQADESPPAQAAPAAESVTVTGSRVDRMGAVERQARPAPLASIGHVPTPPPPAPYYPPANTENYAEIDDNPVHRTSEQPVSTFSVDVDTGSYTNVRRMLNAGIRPPADAVRAEEMINYFDYGHPAPATREVPFRVTTELAPAPWDHRRQLLMIGIKGYDVPKGTLPPANIVMLVDSSGSMRQEAKLPLVKRAMKALAGQLRPQDKVAIVAYAGSAGLVLPPTAGDRKGEIAAAIDGLQAGGSTNGAGGLELAYAMARQGYVEGGINRVILATDGDFNVGIVDRGALETLVADRRKDGIALTTLGFGHGNYNDAMAERLADVGNGHHAYIDNYEEAHRVMVRELGSTLLTIAQDVKIQVEFNPAVVAEYRLIGYENRVLRNEDFGNDKVDAGDIGAGHEVTALYELVPVGSDAAQLPPLRYGDASPAAGARSDEVAHLRLRYKLPGEDDSRLITTPIATASLRSSPSDTLRFAASVAAYADALRGGTHIGEWGWDEIRTSARQSINGIEERGAFARLVGVAQAVVEDYSGAGTP